jgi:hypothetical protein
MMMMMMMMKADIILVVIFISYSFAIAGLRSLFGVLSKAVTDLKYLEKVLYVFHTIHLL